MNLQEITGHEAGAVVYSDGSIWIGNWTGIQGVPRAFATGMLGLGEDLTADARRVAVPSDVKRAMRAWAAAFGGDAPTTGYRARRRRVVGGHEEIIVVTHHEWA